MPYSGMIVFWSNQSVLFSLSLTLSPCPLYPYFTPSLLTQAALMGGTTMVMALVLPEQHCSLLDAYEKCRAQADAKACCDYALHVGVTWWGPKVKTHTGVTVSAWATEAFTLLWSFSDQILFITLFFYHQSEQSSSQMTFICG